MSHKNKKVLNQIFLDPSIYESVTKSANDVGEDIRDHINTILVAVLADGGKIFNRAKDGPMWQAHQVALEMDRQEELRRKAYRVAAQYAENPTEENADRLQAMCDLADVDYADVLSNVARDPFSSIVAKTSLKTGVNKAVYWLTELFNEKKQIPSADVYALGNREGFSKRMIQRARDLINDDPDTPRIDSVRMSSYWVWKFVQPDEPDEEIYIPSLRPKPQINAYFLSTELVELDTTDGETE